jgi:starvation-inducible DNA-binding protein
MANATAKKTGKALTLYPSRIDLAQDIRETAIPCLQEALYAAIDLHWQIKQAHWNVKGKDFIGLHNLFDELAAEVNLQADELAERITSLAGHALGNVRRAAERTPLGELADDAHQAMDLVQKLVDRYAEYGELLRNHIDTTDEAGDAGTADLFTGLSRQVDMRLWFLQAHLQ